MDKKAVLVRGRVLRINPFVISDDGIREFQVITQEESGCLGFVDTDLKIADNVEVHGESMLHLYINKKVRYADVISVCGSSEYYIRRQ